MLDHVIILQQVKLLIEQKSEKAKGARKIQESTFFNALRNIAFQNKKNQRLWELKDFEEDDEMF